MARSDSVALSAARSDFDEAVGRVQAHTPIAYFKLGTEEEGLGFDEIAFIREVAPASVDVVVKIGGPCARNDMRQASRLGAAGLVGPMIESAYALRHFVEAAHEEFPAARHLGINLETISAVRALDDFLALPAVRSLTFINIGRSDLAGSLGLAVGDAAMHEVVCDVAARVRAAGIPIHVGGKVTVGTLGPVMKRVGLDGYHTRFLAFGAPEVAPPQTVVPLALRLEIALLRLLAGRFEERAEAHLERARITASRLEG